MSVVTYTFIVFLLCTVLLYYIVPKKIQWVILLLASLVFYGYAGIEYLLLVIATAVVVYLFSLRLQKSLDEQEELAKDADRRTARKIKAAEKAKRRKAGSFHRRMYSHVYSTTMNTMHSAIPSDVKNRCTTASVIRESSTIL